MTDAVNLSPFLTVEQAAAYLRMSRRSLYEATRLRTVPCRRLPGHRRYLFIQGELDAWANGAELEVTEQARGGVVVRPLVKGRR